MCTYHAFVPLVLSSAPPAIVGGPAQLDVLEGSTVCLQCNNSGYPTPAIIWIKNGKQLETGGRILINPASGQLQVFSVQKDDAGPYMCRAINELGATSYTVSLTVRSESEVWEGQSSGMWRVGAYSRVWMAKCIRLHCFQNCLNACVVSPACLIALVTHACNRFYSTVKLFMLYATNWNGMLVMLSSPVYIIYDFVNTLCLRRST